MASDTRRFSTLVPMDASDTAAVQVAYEVLSRLPHYQEHVIQLLSLLERYDAELLNNLRRNAHEKK